MMKKEQSQPEKAENSACPVLRLRMAIGTTPTKRGSDLFNCRVVMERPGTGRDLVKQDAEGCIHYLGRIDHQVKVRGYRIELQEIEAVLRRVCGTEQVVAVGWPVRNGLAEGIIAFVSRNEAVDENVVLAECRESLPEYMIPRRIYLRSEFPLNANGKTDRQVLIRHLDAEEGQLQETAVLRGSAR